MRWKHSGQSQQHQDYVYDAVQRLVGWKNTAGDSTFYQYDNIGNRNYSGSIGSLSSSVNYTYDRVAQGPDQVQSLLVNDQLGLKQTDYSYSAYGAVTGRTRKNITSGNQVERIESYSQSYRGLLTGYTLDDQQNARTQAWGYRYNAMGEREQKRLYDMQGIVEGWDGSKPWVYYLLGGSREQLAVYHGREQLAFSCGEPGPGVVFYPVEYNTCSITWSGIMLTDSALAEINRKRRQWPLWPWVFFFGPTVALATRVIHPTISTVLTLLWLPAVFMTWRYDKKRRTSTLEYSEPLKSDPIHTEVCTAFEAISKSQTIYLILSQKSLTQLNERKKNAGAGSLVSRIRVRPKFSAPRFLQTNVRVPSVYASLGMYFFPDAILLKKRRELVRVGYEDIQIHASSTKFIESGMFYPKEAPLVEHTWQYVNKSGGPDKRMKNNRKLPVLRYEVVAITLPDGRSAEMQISKPGSAAPFVQACHAQRQREVVSQLMSATTTEQPRPE